MNTMTVKVLNVALVAVLASGLAACDRGVGAGMSQALGESGSTAPAAQAGQVGEAAGDATGDAATGGAKYARVVSVEPVRTTVDNPKQVCHDETVTRTTPPKDEHRIAGTAIGAVAGGLLGNQVGGGKGKTLATVAGAVGGGYAGNRIQANRQKSQVTTSVEQKCETVSNATSKITGYDVRYEYNGVTRTVRMDHDPGDRVQVEEGVSVVTGAH